MGFKLSFPAFISSLFLMVLLSIIFLPVLNSFWVLAQMELDFNGTFFQYVYLQSNAFKGLFHSLIASFFSVLGSGFIGLGFCYLFWRYDFPSKSFFKWLLLTPLLLPPLVIGFGFKIIQATLLKPFFSDMPDWASFLLVIFALVFAFYGYFFLMVYKALKNLDYSIIEAAINLGSTKSKAYRKIIFPEIKKPIIKAILIVGLLSLSAFAIPLLVHREGMFLSTLILNYLPDLALSSISAWVLMFLTLTGLILLLSQLPDDQVITSPSRFKQVFPNKTLPKIQFMLLLGVALVVLLPTLSVFITSFLETTPGGIISLTLDHYNQVLISNKTLEVFNLSLKLALLAGVPNVLFGLVIGLLVTFDKTGPNSWLIKFNLLPLGTPGIVLGIFFYMASTQAQGHTQLFALSASTLLPLAYFAKHMPLMMQNVYRGFHSYRTMHVDAALNLGSSFLRVVGKLIIPLSLSSLATGFIFSFLFAFYEFPISLMLSSPELMPLSVTIFSHIQQGSYGTAAAESMLLLLMISGVLWISIRIFKINLYATGFDSI
jgi:iron(III) transport system permease protein